MPNGKNFANLACSSSSQKLISFVFGFPKLTVSDTSGVSIGYYNPFRYRGYYYDVETGLYYLQSRYYDPVIGRFLNSDEAVIACIPSNILNHNLFAYCLNEPIDNVDYYGFWPKKYQIVNSEKINCYGYVLGKKEWRRVPNWNNSSSVYFVYQQVYYDITKNLKRKVKQLGRYPSSHKFNSLYYYLIAMRVGHGYINGKKTDDYHFWVRHNNGQWSHKPGYLPSQLIGKGSYDYPSNKNWDIPVQKIYKGVTKISYVKNFYNSATYYLAIRKD